MRGRPDAARGDDGSATVWVVVLAMVVVTVAVTGAVLAQAVIARHRAGTAADLAALAAAGRAATLQPFADVAAELATVTPAGPTGGTVARTAGTVLVEWQACSAARAAAAGNGARLSSCSVIDGIADVQVVVAGHGLVAKLGGAHGRARAGPG